MTMCVGYFSLFMNSKKQKKGLDGEGEKQHCRSSLCLSHCIFLKLERERRGRQRREEFMGRISKEKKTEWEWREREERNTNQERESRRDTDINGPQEGI